MVTRVDHVMLAVRDVRGAMETLRDRLGIVPVYGGAHARGTHNGLVCFKGSLAYLELFGPQGDLDSVRTEHAALVDWLESGGGVWKYAVGSADLDEEHARMRRAQVLAAPIGDHSRARPDGVVLKWQMYRVESADEPRLWPFVIQWGPDSERLVELENSGHFPDHPLGVTGLDAVEVLVDDADRVSNAMQKIYGCTIGEFSSSRIELTLGESRVELFEPETAEQRADLQRRGPGPWSVRLAVRNLAASVRYLADHQVPTSDRGNGIIDIDPAAMHNLRLSLTQGL